nr:immunoglobulin heavy chain junction region [Mus musculus]
CARGYPYYAMDYW